MLIKKDHKILIAGSRGMVGRAICRALNRKGYGKENGGELIKTSREVIDFSDQYKVKKWLEKKKVDVVIIAAAKVGGILANQSYPTEFLLENLKIQNNLIENS